MMKHYIYKTQHTNGKYYIGRHSAPDVDRHYYGSGKWPRSIKDKSVLTMTILEYATDFEHLKFLEAQYLREHVGKPGNMNFNTNSVGFASGDLHPNKSDKQRERLRTNNPGMRPEHKEMMRSELNPAKNTKVRQQISQRMTGNNNPMYRAEVIAARSGDNHPSKKDPTVGSKISRARTGIKLNRVICPQCQKSVAINHYPSRHKFKCKGVTQS